MTSPNTTQTRLAQLSVQDLHLRDPFLLHTDSGYLLFGSTDSNI